jgi:hypothetical protein
MFDDEINPNWIAGFVTGDGSFIINLHKNTSYKTNYRVRLRFNIAQHIRDKELLNYMINYFNCGTTHVSKNMIYYDVQEFKDIVTIIIPFFQKYSVKGDKLSNFNKWVEVSKIMEQKMHLTNEGIEEILKIK